MRTIAKILSDVGTGAIIVGSAITLIVFVFYRIKKHLEGGKDQEAPTLFYIGAITLGLGVLCWLGSFVVLGIDLLL